MSTNLDPLLEKVIEKSGKPAAVAADARYKTPAIAQYLIKNEIRLALPYTRPRTKEEYLKKNDFVYDEHYDCYLCPEGQELKYSTKTKEGYRQYFSNPIQCKECRFYLNVRKVKTIRS